MASHGEGLMKALFGFNSPGLSVCLLQQYFSLEPIQLCLIIPFSSVVY